MANTGGAARNLDIKVQVQRFLESSSTSETSELAATLLTQREGLVQVVKKMERDGQLLFLDNVDKVCQGFPLC